MQKNLIGSMRLPETSEALYQWLLNAAKAGIDWVDTAWYYGRTEVEKRLGPVLERLRNEGVHLKVQTKIWPDKYKETEKVFHEQLAALKLKKVDALLLHRPSWNFHDDVAAWETLVKLKKQNLVDEIGVSNYEKDMIEILIAETGVAPTINQIELSVSNFRDDRVFYARQKNIEIQAWSAFGRDAKANMQHPIVQRLAKKYQVAPGTILASFLTSQEINPIHASFNIDHLTETINTVKLNKEEVEELKTLNKYDNKFTELFA